MIPSKFILKPAMSSLECFISSDDLEINYRQTNCNHEGRCSWSRDFYPDGTYRNEVIKDGNKIVWSSTIPNGIISDYFLITCKDCGASWKEAA